ncbi:MAG: CHASE2 domain-containing protein, partial [Pseudomonadota bacterium]
MSSSDTDAMRRGRFGYWTLIGFYLFFGLLTTLLHRGEVTQKMDRLIYDGWVRIHQSPPPDNLVIVGIDSASVERNGRWPWSRVDQATIIQKLSDSDASIILIDILYSEPSKENPDADLLLAESIDKSGRVILPSHTEGKGLDISGGETLPIPIVLEASRQLGHIFLPIDTDGIVRRVYLKAGFKRAHWPLLSLAAMQSLGTAPQELPGVRTQHTDQATKWVGDYEVMIPFHGPKNTFKTVSAFDVLNGEFDPTVFKDSIVLMGLTATGLGDAVPTPILGVDQPLPGVEVHANIYSALQSGSLIGQAGVWVAFALVAVIIALLLMIYSRLRPRWGLLATILLSLVPVFVSFLLYRYASIWFAPLLVAIPVLLAFPLWSWHRLEFATRFLRSETNKLALYDDDLGLTARQPLASLFQSAERHLGLKEWFLFADGNLYSSNGNIGADHNRVTNLEWSEKDGWWVKRFPSNQPLVIGYTFNDEPMNRKFAEFVDSASRVQSKVIVPDTGGTIESLQADADRLSKQNQHILQL